MLGAVRKGEWWILGATGAYENEYEKCWVYVNKFHDKGYT